VVQPNGVLDDGHGEAMAVGLGVGHRQSAYPEPVKATQPLKPVRLLELQARLQALHRRSLQIIRPVSRHGELSIDWTTRSIEQAGKEVRLTNREFAVLEFLMTRPRQSFSREMILEHVWGPSFDSEHNIIEVYVRTLRKKLGQGVIENMRGQGYRFPPSSSIDTC